MNEWRVTSEMNDLMDEWKVCMECRDKAIESFFHSKRAIMYGKQAIKIHRKFWKLVYDLYPELKDGAYTYNFNKQIIQKDE
jgi:hypothetical protein